MKPWLPSRPYASQIPRSITVAGSVLMSFDTIPNRIASQVLRLKRSPNDGTNADLPTKACTRGPVSNSIQDHQYSTTLHGPQRKEPT